jgi:hypothetical protein
MLPEKYWADARIERDKRTEADPWEDILCDSAIDDAGAEELKACAAFKPIPKRSTHYEVTEDGEERVSTRFLLDLVGIAAKDQQPHHASRIARVVKSEWTGPGPLRIGGKTSKGYKRPPFWA